MMGYYMAWFFNKYSEIISQGTFTKEQTLVTENATVKCPLKYIVENPSRNV